MPRKTVLDLRKPKADNRRLVMVTAYDYSMARLVDQAGVDMVLVGDSLGMVVLGEESTVGVSLDAVVHHSRAVAAGLRRTPGRHLAPPMRRPPAW